MQFSTSSMPHMAGGLVLAAQLAGFVDGARAAQPAPDTAALQTRSDVYGIVNLVPSQALVVHINASGQAAFEYIGPDYRAHVGYFDGQRVRHPVAPGRTVSFLGALNDRGELAFLARALAAVLVHHDLPAVSLVRRARPGPPALAQRDCRQLDSRHQ